MGRRDAERAAWLAEFPARNPYPVLRFSEAGRVLYANPASEPLLARWDTRVGAPLPERWRTLTAEVLASGEVREVEVALGARVLALTFTPLPEEGCVNVYGLDITARKQAEGTLRESEETLRQLLRAAPDGIILVDAQGDVVLANAAAQRMFGYRSAELLGRPIGLLVPESVREGHGKHCAGYVDNPHIRPMGQGLELYGQRQDGSKFPVDISLGYVQTQEGVMVMCFILDITRRKRAEARQAQLLRELRSANHELRDFAYVVSHDLKAPLRGISSLGAWLREDYGEQLDAEGQELIALLIGRVERMHNLIEGVLQYSRVGRVREALVEVDVHPLVEDIIDALAPPPHISVTIEGRLPTMTCEVTRIGQVFQNLIGNAIKYMDKPQGRVRVGCEDAGAFWRFYVADNGPGIDAAYFNKIFQLFQTLQPRDEVESTGVGLAVVKKAVTLYGGRVWVDSTVGEGSTFYFTHPKHLEEAGEAPGRWAEADAGA